MIGKLYTNFKDNNKIEMNGQLKYVNEKSILGLDLVNGMLNKDQYIRYSME